MLISAGSQPSFSMYNFGFSIISQTKKSLITKFLCRRKIRPHIIQDSRKRYSLGFPVWGYTMTVAGSENPVKVKS
jgi:hypothetical protein